MKYRYVIIDVIDRFNIKVLAYSNSFEEIKQHEKHFSMKGWNMNDILIYEEVR